MADSIPCAYACAPPWASGVAVCAHVCTAGACACTHACMRTRSPLLACQLLRRPSHLLLTPAARTHADLGSKISLISKAEIRYEG